MAGALPRTRATLVAPMLPLPPIAVEPVLVPFHDEAEDSTPPGKPEKL